MRPHRSISPYRRGPTVDEVLSEARHAVETARTQRDQLQVAVRDLQTDNEELRRQLVAQTDELKRAQQSVQSLERRLRERPAPIPVAAPAAEADTERLAKLERDLENVRRQRTAELERTRIETLTAAAEPLADILDHLGRALAEHPDPDSPWFRGTAAILARTRTALRGLGIEPVAHIGDRFDPAVHEAVGTLQTDELPDGTLADVVKTGLRETTTHTLIRPAMVLVARRSTAGGA